MKNAILLHGTGNSPDSFWLPYIRNVLQQRGFDVWSPQLPNHERPNLADQLPFMLENGTYTSETVMIAHSAGCPLTLAVLEKIPIQIKQAILVAGFVQPTGYLEPFKPLLRDPYDWKTIQHRVQDFIAINSENDPWGCNDTQGRIMAEAMGGTLIIAFGEGHMGSHYYQQPYTEFPLLAKLID